MRGEAIERDQTTSQHENTIWHSVAHDEINLHEYGMNKSNERGMPTFVKWRAYLQQ